MLDILEKIKNDECEYLRFAEFEKLSNGIANTINSTTRKQNRATYNPCSFSDIDLSGTPTDVMLKLFNHSTPISKKLKSLEHDEESATNYIKQLLIFYGAGVALYNKYYDSVIAFSHEQYTYELVLYNINIRNGNRNTIPVLLFDFMFYGGDYHEQSYTLDFLFDDSNYSVPAEINSIKVNIESGLGVSDVNYHRQVVISSINSELFKECVKDVIDIQSKNI